MFWACVSTIGSAVSEPPPYSSRGCVERYLNGSAFSVEPLLRPDHGFPIRQPMLVGPEPVVERLRESLRGTDQGPMHAMNRP